MRTWLSRSLRRITHGSDRAVFLHIQKTAGTSLVHLAARHYGQENIITHGDYVGRRPEELVKIPFVSGHFGYDYAKELIRERKSFTFLRDPAERILSLFYFYRSQDPATFPMYRIAHECTLSEFLLRGLEDPYVKPRLWNNQTWQLAHGYSAIDGRKITDFTQKELIDMALEHLQKFTYVGLTESYDTDASNIAKMLGWVVEVNGVRENVGSKRRSMDDLTGEESGLLNELVALDRILYKHAKESRHGA